MKLRQAIANRRSIRRFLPAEVPQDKVLRVLDSARLCQSAKNRQPWRFLVVRGGRRRQLAQLLQDWAEARPGVPSSSGQTADVIRQTPVLILVFCAKDSLWHDDDYLSIGGAMEHMCLTAQAEGLGALWIRDTVYAEEALRQATGYPDLDLAGAVALGYPAENPPMRPRLSLAELMLPALPEPRRETLSSFWVMGREGSTEALERGAGLFCGHRTAGCEGCPGPSRRHLGLHEQHGPKLCSLGGRVHPGTVSGRGAVPGTGAAAAGMDQVAGARV